MGRIDNMRAWTSRTALVLQIVGIFAVENGIENFIKEVESQDSLKVDDILNSLPSLDSVVDQVNNISDASELENMLTDTVDSILQEIVKEQTTQAPFQASTVEAFYGEWKEWGDCSGNCGNGTRRRVRMCFRENELVQDLNQCVKEEDPDQRDFSENEDCEMPNCATTIAPSVDDLVTIPDPDSFMEGSGDSDFVTKVYET